MFAIEYLTAGTRHSGQRQRYRGRIPLSAFTASTEIASAYKPGDPSFAFGGNPISCAAALPISNFMEKGKSSARAQKTGNYAMSKLRDLQKSNALIGEVRDWPQMIGVDSSRMRRKLQPARSGRNSRCLLA